MEKFQKAIYMTLITSIVLLLYGCGQTNFLQWAKPTEKQDDLEMARMYLDQGEYDKAAIYCKNNTSPEGRILYAQCLMGQADVDLAAIIKALNDESISNNPVMRLEPLVKDPSDRSKLMEAGDIYLVYTPKKTSDKIIGSLSTMIAHVGNLKNAFPHEFKDLNTIYTNTTIVSTNYSALGQNPLRYVTRASELIISISKQADINEAITSMNNTIKAVNDLVSTNVNIQTWQNIKVLFGY